MMDDPTTPNVDRDASERDPLEALAATIEGVRERLDAIERAPANAASADSPGARPQSHVPPSLEGAPAVMAVAATAERPAAQAPPPIAVEAAPLHNVIELRRFEEALTQLPAVRVARALSYARGAARFELELAYPGAPWHEELRRVIPHARVWGGEGGATVALPAESEQPGEGR